MLISRNVYNGADSKYIFIFLIIISTFLFIYFYILLHILRLIELCHFSLSFPPSKPSHVWLPALFQIHDSISINCCYVPIPSLHSWTLNLKECSLLMSFYPVYGTQSVQLKWQSANQTTGVITCQLHGKSFWKYLVSTRRTYCVTLLNPKAMLGL